MSINTPAGPGRTEVRCPICLNQFDLAVSRLVTETGGVRADFLPRHRAESEAAYRDRLRLARRVCPHEDLPTSPGPHTLPYRYDLASPIVVGVIGTRAAGKTHLLAAMIHRLFSAETGERLNIAVDPIDEVLHREYMNRTVDPFISQRVVLQTTQPPRVVVPFTDALEIRDARDVRHAVAFFDVDGESLQSPEVSLPFLGAVNALIFVVDPTKIRNLTSMGGHTSGDPAFSTVIARVTANRQEQGAQFLRIPAAIVVGKADLLTYRNNSIITKWMTERTADEEEVDLRTLEEESEDAWVYLSVVGAREWLSPARRFVPSTLHFASAAGTDANDGTFAETGFRQVRVLKPVLSLLQANRVQFAQNSGDPP